MMTRDIKFILMLLLFSCFGLATFLQVSSGDARQLTILFSFMFLISLLYQENNFKSIRDKQLGVMARVNTMYQEVSGSLKKKQEKIDNLQSRLSILQNTVKAESINTYKQLEKLLSIYVESGVEFPIDGLRGWSLSPDILLLIYRQIKKSRPKLIVELGSGNSTLFISRVLDSEGMKDTELISLDHSEEFTEKTLELLKVNSSNKNVTVLHAPLSKNVIDNKNWQWYEDKKLINLLSNKKIDLLIIDGPPEGTQKYSRYPAIPKLERYLAKNSLVFLDDYNREDEKEVVRRWLKKYPLVIKGTDVTEKGTILLEFKK